jgi:hypothetical protein
MAEAKRRTDVKKFEHITAYPRPARESPRSLFEETLINSDHNWNCTSICDVVPPVGSTVLVRIGRNKTLDVLWGNQVIANITDTLGNELAATLGNSVRASGIVATIVSSDDVHNQFAIKFEQDAR